LWKPSLDLNEVYAPIARIESIRLAATLSSERGWALSPIDVKTNSGRSFFRPTIWFLEEEGWRKKCSNLRKPCMGWNKHQNFGIIKFLKCSTEYGVNAKGSTTTQLQLIYLYIDGFLVTCNNKKEIEEFKRQVKFEMSNLRKPSYFLGMKFVTVYRETTSSKEVFY
jgi:hypothetical protein